MFKKEFLCFSFFVLIFQSLYIQCSSVSENILEYIEFDADEDHVKLKKEILPVLQDVLEVENESPSKVSWVLPVVCLGASVVAGGATFFLFDTIQKQSEELKRIESKLCDSIDKIRKEHDKKAQKNKKEAYSQLEEHKQKFEKVEEALKTLFGHHVVFDKKLDLQSEVQRKVNAEHREAFCNLSDKMLATVNKIKQDQKEAICLLGQF